MKRVCCINCLKGIGGRREKHPREQGQRQTQIQINQYINQRSPTIQIATTVTTNLFRTKTVHNHQHHNQNHKHPHPNPTNNNTNRK